MNRITFPHAAQSIHAQASGFIGQLKSHVASQASQLDKLSRSLHTPSELADSAAGLAALREQLNSLLFSGFAVALTPYQYRIGTQQRLSADTAATFAAQKLTEQYDPVSGKHGLALVITGSTESTFAANLSAITTLLAFPEWLAVTDHAQKNAILAIEKMQIPARRLNPYWRTDDYAYQAPLSTTQHYLSAELAQAQACAESAVSPVERLKQLAALQSQTMDTLLTDVSNFIRLFQGQCYAVRLTGTPANMAKQLRETRISAEPYSTLFLMVSDQEPTFFYQMVNV
ncbi:MULTISPECIES: hypothetical protein [unclassified Vibrio]|uniref:hypothetical protein n=1 Tax=unclassified Vibrio TaxID=2614977 RepID=UPI0013615C85|nr:MULTISPECIES: hypothetical protein [unclassified Vibrio]NAW59635.1 hypothetical protein [Vibrio sp. V36_P2S2PM302]NAX25025.1 hypothetical protein [Vibrio sp. V38_P2S17PM301]NAX28611.1 hypothetical protein [Vibrio sp. V37_P2S8PM304]